MPARSNATETEQSLVFEKELSLLREKQAEAAQVDLLDILLDLGKIGIDRRVRNEAARKPVLEVEPRVYLEVVAERDGDGPIRRHRRERVRLYFKVDGLPRRFEAHEGRRRRSIGKA